MRANGKVEFDDKRLLDRFPNWYREQYFFKYLAGDWVNDFDMQQVCISYMGRSGGKLESPFVTRIMDLVDDEHISYDTGMEMIGATINANHGLGIKQVYNALNAEYELLNNVSLEETTTTHSNATGTESQTDNMGKTTKQTGTDTETRDFSDTGTDTETRNLSGGATETTDAATSNVHDDGIHIRVESKTTEDTESEVSNDLHDTETRTPNLTETDTETRDTETTDTKNLSTKTENTKTDASTITTKTDNTENVSGNTSSTTNIYGLNSTSGKPSESASGNTGSDTTFDGNITETHGGNVKDAGTDIQTGTDTVTETGTVKHDRNQSGTEETATDRTGTATTTGHNESSVLTNEKHDGVITDDYTDNTTVTTQTTDSGTLEHKTSSSQSGTGTHELSSNVEESGESSSQKTESTDANVVTEHTSKGSSALKTPQDMVSAELELRKTAFFDYLFTCIDSIVAVKCY